MTARVYNENVEYVERIPKFWAEQCDGTEENARYIIEKAYQETWKAVEPESHIKWISLSEGRSYFSVIVHVKYPGKPAEKWETEPGDWVVRDQNGFLDVFTDERFHKKFQKVVSV